MLSGSLDEGECATGLLCVTGGSQVRTGPHRMLHELATRVSAAGFPVFRYERRGLGDSDGDDAGYRSSGEDLAAAAAAFRTEVPHVRIVAGFGLCDGATTLALHGREAGVDRLVLANPWLVEAEAGDVAPAAARVHYRARLLSARAWRDVLGGKVDLLGAAGSLFGALTKTSASSLGDEVADKLKSYAGRVTLILSEGDNTAIAAKACWAGASFAHIRDDAVVAVPTDAHTFARDGDLEPVVDTVIAFLRAAENEA